jgi:hypothetical protein
MISNERWLENRNFDVTPYIKTKQSMSYISWGDCEYLMRRLLTDEEFVNWESHLENSTVFIHFFGYPVYSLAVSDFRNNAIPNPDCTDVEDTRQRAFVKAVARCFGIGHKLYEGTSYDGSPAENKAIIQQSSSVSNTFVKKGLGK